MYILLGGFCNNFLPLEVFPDYLGYSITSVEVFNKSDNWKVGK